MGCQWQLPLLKKNNSPNHADPVKKRANKQKSTCTSEIRSGKVKKRVVPKLIISKLSIPKTTTLNDLVEDNMVKDQVKTQPSGLPDLGPIDVDALATNPLEQPLFATPKKNNLEGHTLSMPIPNTFFGLAQPLSPFVTPCRDENLSVRQSRKTLTGRAVSPYVPSRVSLFSSVTRKLALPAEKSPTRNLPITANDLLTPSHEKSPSKERPETRAPVFPPVIDKVGLPFEKTPSEGFSNPIYIPTPILEEVESVTTATELANNDFLSYHLVT